MWYFLSFWAGLFAGVFVMCLLQMARTDSESQP